MKHSETIQEQNFRLRQLAIETSKKTKHNSFVYISKGIAKKVNL